MATPHLFLQSLRRLGPIFAASGVAISVDPFSVGANANSNGTDCDSQPEESPSSARANSQIRGPPLVPVPNIIPYSTLASPGDPNSILEKKHPQEGCEACLYTGMATCTGLSLYFAKIALLEIPDITKEMAREVAKGHQRNRAGFLVVSAFWVAAGAYRWHLG